jgi:hypothetical protein
MTNTTAVSSDRRVLVLPLEPGLLCLRGLSPRRLRFEIEYGLERGTTANSFLFAAGTTLSGASAGTSVPPVACTRACVKPSPPSALGAFSTRAVGRRRSKCGAFKCK